MTSRRAFRIAVLGLARLFVPEAVSPVTISAQTTFLLTTAMPGTAGIPEKRLAPPRRRAAAGRSLTR